MSDEGTPAIECLAYQNMQPFQFRIKAAKMGTEIKWIAASFDRLHAYTGKA